MGRPGPTPETIARAWELAAEGRTPAYIGEALGVSRETARKYVQLGMVAESWLIGDDERATLEMLRAKYAAALDRIAADGVDRYNGGGGLYEQVAPVVLRAIVEGARMAGVYTRLVGEGGSNTAPAEVDPDVVAAVDAARKRRDAERSALLTEEEES